MERELGLNSKHRTEITLQRALRSGVKGLIWALVLLDLPAAGAASQKRPHQYKISGFVVEVNTTSVTIRQGKTNETTLLTREDFTERVAVGSKVAAWYVSGEGGNVLSSMVYPLGNLFRPASEIRSSIRKVIVLPDSAVPGAEGIFDAIAKYLQSNFGWYVAPRMLAEEIRNRLGKSASTLDALDPTTGNFDMTGYLQGPRSIIRKLAEDTRVDAVLEVKVERVMANVSGKIAFWDGVQQPIASKKARMLTSMGGFAGQGEVPAATVDLKLSDAQGKLLWNNRRGFAVLALLVGLGNAFREHPLEESLADTASVEKWLQAVFRPLQAETSLEKQASAVPTD